MIVLKFGGTSVGDAARIRVATGIVADAILRQPIVVVSALAGVTNDLIQATDLAGSRNLPGAREIVDRVRLRHEEIAFELVQQKSDFLESFSAQLTKKITDLERVLESISDANDVTPRNRDQIAALGEKLSSVLFAYTLRLRTLNGVHVDSEDVIATDDQHGSARPDPERTAANAEVILRPEVRRGHIPVLGGFFGRSISGATSTLGRGGSDYSAAIISAAVDADEIQIWTDVDGMMTVDPRIVPSARPVERLSYAEAATLARRGAKVLHPETVSPALAKSIPIRIVNTHNPKAKGTLIAADEVPDAGPRAMTVQRDEELPDADLITIVAGGRSSGVDETVRTVCERIGITPIGEIRWDDRSLGIRVARDEAERLVVALHRALFETGR